MIMLVGYYEGINYEIDVASLRRRAVHSLG